MANKVIEDTSIHLLSLRAMNFRIPESPIHPLSAFVTIVLDGLWSIPEFAVTASIVGLPVLLILILSLFFVCFLTVLLIQRFVAHDSWGASAAKGVAMGIAAAVPYAIIGTVAGALLLIWAGVYHLQQQGLVKTN